MSGKRYFQTTDIELLGPMIVIGLLAALFFPALISPRRGNPFEGVKLGSALLVTGFLCLLAAKISLFRRRIWTSWGPKHMTAWWARLYKAGYLLMGVGLLVVLAANRAMRVTMADNLRELMRDLLALFEGEAATWTF